MYCTNLYLYLNVIYILTITGTSSSREKRWRHGNILGCHGLSRVLLKLSQECNGNVHGKVSAILEYMKCTARTCTCTCT